jgi:hypothetical protein
MERLLSMLLVLFIGLKLTGHITWPWLYVLSPVLAPLSLGGILIIIIAILKLLKTNES